MIIKNFSSIIKSSNQRKYDFNYNNDFDCFKKSLNYINRIHTFLMIV